MQDAKGVSLISRSWRSSVVEQLTCNQQVGGSTPFASSVLWYFSLDGFYGEVAEWTKAADCKSAGASLRRFESFPPQNGFWFRIWGFGVKGLSFESATRSAGVAQLARASAFQAEGRGFESRLPLCWCMAHVAQTVEHILGKDVVGGSSPPVGSRVFDGFIGVKSIKEVRDNVEAEV